jgi:uncharacterized membrane protein YtjA (UPF0391 family)
LIDEAFTRIYFCAGQGSSSSRTRQIKMLMGVDKMVDLLYLAVVFFAIALILGVLGWRGAGISMDIAKWLVIAFIILAILSLVFGGSINLATLLLAA